jgi:serine protease Do
MDKHALLGSVALICLAIGAAPADRALEVIELRDGCQVIGAVIAEKTGAIYVDVGFHVIRIPREHVVHRGAASSAGERTGASSRHLDADPTGFFSSVALRAAPVKELVATFGPAVIAIDTPSGKGSGFIINDNGYAVTNAHVIEGETRIAATLYENTPGGLARHRIENVEIVALNPFVDLALLRLPARTNLKYSHVVLGSVDDLNSGDGVFAVGNPLGLERSVSQGIVSSPNRVLDDRIYVQTDAAINPGNSGGPLFNLRGEVVGVTSLGYRKTDADNLAFAIPVNVVKDFVRNRDAFAFTKANPNIGFRFLDPPRRRRATLPATLRRVVNGKPAAGGS